MTNQRTHRMTGRAVIAASTLLMLACAKPRPPAGDGMAVIDGSPLSTGEIAAPDEGEVFLYGPVQLSHALRNAEIVSLRLEGVKFEGERGSHAELYIVDGEGKPDRLTIDPGNYVGSAAHVAGGATQTPEVSSEINDFTADGREFKARTNFRNMNEVYLAVVVKSGKVGFERAVISSVPPAGK